MANLLDLELVKEYIVHHGGKIRNHDLVTHFKSYLNDPENKSTNRETFKECVNKLAIVKSENGEKMIILKKKYRPGTHVAADENVNPEPNATDVTDGGSKSETGSIASREGSTEGSGPSMLGSDMSSPIDSTPERSRESSAGAQGDVSRESSASMEDAEDQEVSPIVSVKDRALFLNSMQTVDDDTEDLDTSVQLRKKTKFEKSSTQSEDDPGLLNLTDPTEREWMVISAKSDYQTMARMLIDFPNLAAKKELTSGYTPLHWACKHGQGEVVKLLAGKHSAPVNPRSHGGYTPLHMAALHGHENLIELLVQTYGADVNIRDYSGKKPKHYLKISAQAHTQHLLQPARKPDSSDDVDANANVKGSSSKQGISSLLIPLNNNIRASFRRSKTASTRPKSPTRSPNLFRRASEKSLNSNKPSKKKFEKQRPVSEQAPQMSRVNSDPEMKKSFFI